MKPKRKRQFGEVPHNPGDKQLYLPPLPYPLESLRDAEISGHGYRSHIVFTIGGYRLFVQRVVCEGQYVTVSIHKSTPYFDFLGRRTVCGEEEVVPLILDMIAELAPLEALAASASPIQHARFMEIT